jgi:hypothetical protein
MITMSANTQIQIAHLLLVMLYIAPSLPQYIVRAQHVLRIPTTGTSNQESVHMQMALLNAENSFH